MSRIGRWGLGVYVLSQGVLGFRGSDFGARPSAPAQAKAQPLHLVASLTEFETSEAILCPKAHVTQATFWASMMARVQRAAPSWAPRQNPEIINPARSHEYLSARVHSERGAPTAASRPAGLVPSWLLGFLGCRVLQL